MIVYKKVVTLFCFIVFLSTYIYCQENTNYENSWIKIDSIFSEFEVPPGTQNSCWFECEKGTEPNVDLWDVGYETILSDISKSQVLKIFNYYSEYCKECDTKNLNYLLDSNASFLSDESYSIELNYKVSDNSTVGILSLIYYSEGYVLFSMGPKKD